MQKNVHRRYMLALLCMFVGNDCRANLADLAEIVSVSAQCPTVLHASDFGTTGKTLDTSGTYILCDDISYNGDANSNAFEVTADNVIIDLNGKSVTLFGGNANVTGVSVASDKHDIVIKNGSFAKFTEYGIEVNNLCYNIAIDGVNVNGDGVASTSGIYFAGSSGNDIHDCAITNCTITDLNASGYGCQLAFTKSVLLENVTISNNTFTGSGIAACYLSACNACLIRGSRFVNNTFTVNSVTSYVFNALNSDALTVKGCAISANSATGTSASLNLCNTTLCDGAIIKNNTITGNSSTGNIYSIYLSNCVAPSVEGCSANYNRATTGAAFAYGFLLTSTTEAIISNSTASNIYTAGTGLAVGIIVSTACDNTIIRNCRFDNTTAATPANSNGIRINVGKTIVQDCSIFGSSGTGIYNDSADSVITGCTIGNNGTNLAGSYPPLMTEAKGNVIYGDSAGSDSVDYKDGIIYLTENAIADAGYTISVPGTYVLTEDVNITPTGALNAITINADNVTLDLNGKMIRQANTQASVTAISIASAKHDIVIKNGVLAEFSEYSIEVTQNCYNITIDNIHVAGNGASTVGGIHFIGASGNEVHDFIISNCTISELNASGDALYIDYGRNITVLDTDIANNSLTGVASASIAFDYSNACSVFRCRVVGNTYSSSGYGINTIQGSSILFDSVTVSENSFVGAGNAFYLNNTPCCTIQRSTIEKNSSSTSTMYTVFLDVNSDNNVIVDNRINANSGTITTGIRVSSNNVYIADTISTNNSSTSGIADGIRLESGSGHTVINCTCNNNSASTPANGRGIFVGVLSTIQNCSAYGNSGTGIYNNSAAAIITDCKVGNNLTNFDGLYPPLTTSSKGNVIYGDSAGADSLDYKNGKIYIFANTIGTTGVTLSSAGEYVLAEDVPFTPGASSQTAITINADYVTLNLNGKTLYHNDSSNLTSGIAINSGKHDIVIKNGTIARMYNNSTTTDSYSIFFDESCANIEIDSVTISGRNSNDSMAIGMIGGSGTEILGATIRNCTISNCMVGGSGSADVVLLSYVQDGSVLDTVIDSNTIIAASAKSFFGLQVVSTNQVLVANCVFSNNTMPSDNTAVGGVVEFNSCTAMTVDNCTFTANSHAGNALNMIRNQSASALGFTIKDCLFSYNRTTGVSGTVLRCIFERISTGTLIENCTMIGNSAVTTFYGIQNSDASVGAIMRNCLIQGNSAGGTAYGISAVTLSDSVIEDCIVHGLTGTTSAYGIYVDSTAVDVVVRRCICSSIVHGTPANGVGFYNASTTAAFYENRAIRNSTNFAGDIAGNIPTAHTVSRFGVVSTPPYYDSENLDIS